MGLLAALFGARPAPPTAAQEDEQRRSQAQVEAGGLTIGAQRRLRALGAADDAGAGGFFTSDLSVNGFALLHREGIAPLTQVMGTSVFSKPQGGYAYGYRSFDRGRRVHEVTLVSDAYNGARERALSRLAQEAELAGADAVVGVRMGTGGHDWSGGASTEFVAVGTAVRLPPALRTGRPVITDLTAAEYWQLARAGYRPVGVVGFSTVLYVGSSWEHNQILTAMRMWGGPGSGNQELGEFTDGYRLARHQATREIEAQAAAVAADGIVGVTIAQHLAKVDWESNNRSHVDLVVSLHLLGTAITEGHEPLRPAEPLTILPLRSQGRA